MSAQTVKAAQLVKTGQQVASAHQETVDAFNQKRDRQRDKCLKGLPWLLGEVGKVVTILQEEFPKVRFKRVFWNEEDPGDGCHGYWELEISYPNSEMRSNKGVSLEDSIPSLATELMVTLVGRGRSR